MKGGNNKCTQGTTLGLTQGYAFLEVVHKIWYQELVARHTRHEPAALSAIMPCNDCYTNYTVFYVKYIWVFIKFSYQVHKVHI